MSTATPEPTSAPPPATSPWLLHAAARSLFAALMWGGVLLLILAWWLGLKFAADERSLILPWLVCVLGAAGLGLAGWHAFVLWIQRLTPEQQAASLLSLRRLSAFALLGGGCALLVIAVLLGFVPRPGGTGGWTALKAMFGEAVGLFLFALITTAAGWALLAPPREELATVDLEPVRNLFPLIRTGLFLLGAVALGAFLLLAFYNRVGAAYFPELAGLLLFSMLCLAMGLWLWSNPAPDPFATRVFVLVFGGSTGFILFLMTVARVIAWRGDILGGMTAWQGDDAWQLWLCVYLQLISLALMFGSLLLARADIRSNPVLRRVLFGYNTLLNGLLVLEMLLVLNVVAYAMVPYTFDWTRTRGLHALAQSSKNLLHQLKRPTHIYVLSAQGFSMQSDIRTLIGNLEAESNNVKVEYVSPDRDRIRYEDLAKVFPKILPTEGGKFVTRDMDTGRGILLVYGKVPETADHKVPYAFIPERKIYEDQPAMPGQRATRSFRGEVEVMKELNYLVAGQQKRKLYFLQGDDEINIFENEAARRRDPRGEMSLLGAAMLIDKLKKDNYEVEAITFNKEFADDPKHKTDRVRYLGSAGADKQVKLPEDAYAVIIAGASSPLPKDGLTALEKYVERGGKLMVLLDLVLSKDLKAKDIRDLRLRESGVEDMLKRYGIGSTDEFAVAQVLSQFRIPWDPFNIPAAPPEKTENTLAKQFFDRIVYFQSVRVIRPATAPAGRFKAETVFATLPWREDQADSLPAVIATRDFGAFANPREPFIELKERGELLKRVREELPLVVAVSEDTRPRLVVFGDTEFISNYSMMTGERSNNYSLFVSGLEWMAEHEALMGPQPKVVDFVSMPEAVALQPLRIHIVPLWLMFLAIVGLGGGIWLVRRR